MIGVGLPTNIVPGYQSAVIPPHPSPHISMVSDAGVSGGSIPSAPVNYAPPKNDDAANANLNIDPAGEEESTTTSSSGQGSEFSLSQLMMDHPEMSPEQLLKEAAKYSDEYAEMYTTYLLEQQRHEADNAYTAEREDTAYQRLVEDLKAAGLNPAMLYGSTASTHATGASGYSSIAEGAHTRDVKNYQLLETLILALKKATFDQLYKSTNTIWKIADGLHDWRVGGINTILKLFGLS